MSHMNAHRRAPVIGLVALVVATALTAAVYSGAWRAPFAADRTEIRATFADTRQLAVGDQVRVRGVNVGAVSDIALDDGGRTAIVTMEVADEALPVYSDARVTVRWRTVLGGTFAIDLDRGSPTSGDLGSRTIPTAQTASQVELDDVLGAVRDPQRDGIRTTLDELPEVFADRDAPAEALDAVADKAPTLRRALDAARGREDGDLARLVGGASRVVRALNRPRDRMTDVVEGAARTLRTTAGRARDIETSIDLLATRTPAIRGTLSRLDRTLTGADGLLVALEDPAGDVAPAVRALRPVVADAEPLLTEARPVIRSLQPAVRSLVQTARTGTPVLEKVAPSIDRLRDHILPFLAERDPVSKRTTYEMIGPTFASTNSAMGGFDGNSHLFRFPLFAQGSILDTAPCGVFATNPEKSAIVQCENLLGALQKLTEYEPFANIPGTRP